MRLINANYFIKQLGFDNTENERENDIAQTVTLSDFDNCPTAYDIDEVVERLEEQKQEEGNVTLTKIAYNTAIEDAIEIVKKGGVE